MASNRNYLGNRLLRIVIIVFLLGFAIVVGIEILRSFELIKDKAWYNFIVHAITELGIALIVASIVAFTFEQLLSEERIMELTKLHDELYEMKSYGFKKIFASRQAVFDELFEKAIPSAKQQIKIMGLCVSLFKETDRVSRSSKHDPKRLKEDIVARIIQGCEVKVLYLKRYPTDSEISSYGITDAHFDFFWMRERDEDSDINFLHGKRLKKIANESHGEWIKILVLLADRIKDNHKDFGTEEARRQLFNRLDVREYFALPSVSLYILDDEIYVSPYLYKKHCSDVPAFKVGPHDTPLFEEYDAHFSAAWDNEEFTVPAIPSGFIDVLAKDPRGALKLYKQKEAEIMEKQHIQRQNNQELSEDPDYFRVAEKAIDAMLEIKAGKNEASETALTHG